MPALTPTILCDGSPLDPAYVPLSIDITRDLDRIPVCELRVLDGNVAARQFALSDSGSFDPGKSVEIKLRYEGQADATVFKGVVVCQGLTASSAGSVLQVRCKDAAVKLSTARQSAVFRDLSDSEIIQQLIQDAGLTLGDVPSTQPQHKEMVQYRCTAWDFMLSRADAMGLLVNVTDGTISLHAMQVPGSAALRLEYGIDEIYSFDLEANAELQHEGVASTAWDPKQQQATPATQAAAVQAAMGDFDAAALASTLGTGTCSLSHPVALPSDELQAWADARLARNRLALIRGRVAVPGRADVALMDGIELASVGKHYSGTSVITGIRHRVDVSGWRTDLQLGLSPTWFAKRASIAEPAAGGLLPPISGLQIGVVAAFEDDPDKEYRVKVQIPGIDAGSDNAVWAQLAAPEAGLGRGYYFRPEAGDEVVLGFLNNDPRRPVIVGALFGSKNTPPASMGEPSDANEQRGIVSKKGTTIGFVDRDKASVFIATAQNNKLLLDDDGESISLSDQHGNEITMSKDGIVLRSKAAVRIEADKDIALQSSKDTVLKSDAGLQIDASQAVAIKGSQVDVK